MLRGSTRSRMCKRSASGRTRSRVDVEEEAMFAAAYSSNVVITTNCRLRNVDGKERHNGRVNGQ
jgi:hypothetical protein